MFDLGVGGLIAAYVVLGLLLLSLHLYSGWSPWIKGAVTLVVTGFYLVTYTSYPQLLGWPLATERLPSRLYLLAVHTTEPDTIYLWARDLDQGFGNKRPRAYELPYSKSLHKKVSRAGRKLRRNIPVMVEIDPLPPNTRPQIEQGEAVTVHASRVRFTDIPEGLAPLKD